MHKALLLEHGLLSTATFSLPRQGWAARAGTLCPANRKYWLPLTGVTVPPWTTSDLVKVTLQWGSARADRKLYALNLPLQAVPGSKQGVNISQINESAVVHNFNLVSHTEFYNILMQGKGFQVFKKHQLDSSMLLLCLLLCSANICISHWTHMCWGRLGLESWGHKIRVAPVLMKQAHNSGWCD